MLSGAREVEGLLSRPVAAEGPDSASGLLARSGEVERSVVMATRPEVDAEVDGVGWSVGEGMAMLENRRSKREL